MNKSEIIIRIAEMLVMLGTPLLTYVLISNRFERFKIALQKELHVFQMRYSAIHTKRIDATVTLFELLGRVQQALNQWRLQYFSFGKELGPEPGPITECVEKLETDTRRLFDFFSEKRAILDESMGLTLSLIRGPLDTIIEASRQHGQWSERWWQKKEEEIIALSGTIPNYINNVIATLESEGRRVLDPGEAEGDEGKAYRKKVEELNQSSQEIDRLRRLIIDEQLQRIRHPSLQPGISEEESNP
jgi:hypothetical protein